MTVETLVSRNGKVRGTAVRATTARNGASVIIIRRVDTGTVCVLPESEVRMPPPEEGMIACGQKVEWQSELSTHWHPGRVTGRRLEPDGSLTYHLADCNRGRRSITASKVRLPKTVTQRRRG